MGSTPPAGAPIEPLRVSKVGSVHNSLFSWPSAGRGAEARSLPRCIRLRSILALTFVLAFSSLVPVSAAAPIGVHSLVASDGGLFNYGDASYYGSASGLALNRPVEGMAATPDGKGYWLVASDGGLFTYGDATFYGSTGGLALNRPVVGMAATPDGRGYWLVASDGGIFSYGDARFYGSTGGLALNRPVVGMAATPDGRGYWLVASDGGIFSYGDATFYGSTGGLALNRPVVGMAATPDGRGYWLVASDGGIFSYGDATFYGSTGGLALNRPVVGMAATPDGKGYWLVASDGGIFTYGNAPFFGSSGNAALNRNVVGMAATPDGRGYWLVASGGGMPAPAGYTNQQLIFDDQFSGTSLDTTKWNTYMGAQGSIWNDFGRFSSPYSGLTPPSQGGSGTDAEMYAPSQVSVDNGVTLTAQRNTSGPTAQYANPSEGGFATWLSGVLTTEGKFDLPTTGWYVQAKIKMPDMTQGMEPGMWFLPAGPGAFNEIDDVQGGFVPCGGPSPNYCPVAAGYFDNAGNAIGDANPNVGFDASAGYHVYGIEWIPGVSVKEYVDGNLVWSVTQSQVPGGIVAQAYEIILNLVVTASKDSGWATVPTATSPGGSMDVAEVQAYSHP